MKKLMTFMISTGILLSLFFPACQTDQPAPKEETLPLVVLSRVEKEEIARKIHTYGRLSTKQEIKLSFKIPGIIREIFVDEGQKVSDGQLLAQLDLSEIESQVKQAESAYKKAQRDLDRVENLYKEKAATLEQAQNTRTAYDMARSNLDIARFNKKFSSIKAPSNGIILKRLMEENELVSAGYPVFVFASVEDDWIVRAGISDRDLVRIQKNDPAVIFFDAYPDKSFPARIVEIVESADRMTGTFEIELRMDPARENFVSGFVAKVDITPSKTSPYYVIPVEALVEAQGRQGFVFTCDRTTKIVTRIPVVIGFLYEDKAAVISGLEEVEEIVTEGAPFLTDSQKVKILDKAE